MSSVIARKIRSAPHRPAAETWRVISSLLCSSDDNLVRELSSVSGISASTIVDRLPEKEPIIVIGKGPRIRFYCLYGDDAITGDEHNEDALPLMPLQGDWTIHIPFASDEVAWATGALRQHSKRICPYDAEIGLDSSSKAKAAQSALDLDLDALNRL